MLVYQGRHRGDDSSAHVGAVREREARDDDIRLDIPLDLDLDPTRDLPRLRVAGRVEDAALG